MGRAAASSTCRPAHPANASRAQPQSWHEVTLLRPMHLKSQHKEETFARGFGTCIPRGVGSKSGSFVEVRHLLAEEDFDQACCAGPCNREQVMYESVLLDAKV